MGTRGVANILSSVDKSGKIVSFVQTSSIASVGFVPGRQVTESDWSTYTIEDNPYAFAKRKGEEAVWEMTKGKSYRVAAINPTMVFGPVLAKAHCKASPFVFRQALLGNPQPNNPYSVVDVRNVAQAHVEALLRPEANGKRFILDGAEAPMLVTEIITTCRKMFPTLHFGGMENDKTPSGPKMQQSATDNTLSQKILGIQFISAEQTIRESVASMIDNGHGLPGSVELFSADLLTEGAYDKACENAATGSWPPVQGEKPAIVFEGICHRLGSMRFSVSHGCYDRVFCDTCLQLFSFASLGTFACQMFFVSLERKTLTVWAATAKAVLRLRVQTCIAEF